MGGSRRLPGGPVHSTEVPRPLSFGTGPHYCLGANLARMMIEEAIRSLARRSVEPAGDMDAVEWRAILGRRPVALPVVVRPLGY